MKKRKVKPRTKSYIRYNSLYRRWLLAEHNLMKFRFLLFLSTVLNAIATMFWIFW